jgi:hypothetical protein
MTKPEASQLVAILFGSYPSAHIERTHVDAYVSGIVDLPANVAAEAVTRLRRTSKFLPAIAEIREACAAQTHGPARSGEEAYAELMLAVNRHGRDYGQGAPKFRDPIITRCLGIWGTWNDVCGSPVDDPGGRARFIELYDDLATRKRQDQAAGKALPTSASTAPAFWLERPKAPKAQTEPMPALALRPIGPRQPSPYAGRKLSADEIDAALNASEEAAQ